MLVKYSIQLDFINSVHTFTKYLLEKTLLCVKKYFFPPLSSYKILGVVQIYEWRL